jgi:hypothetical protein
VPLEKPVGLETAKAQRLRELVIADPVLAVKFDEERLPRLVTEVRSARAKFLLDVQRYLKAYINDNLLMRSYGGGARRDESRAVNNRHFHRV